MVYFLDQLRNNTDQCLVLQILPTLSSVSPSKKSSGQWVHTHLLWYQCYIVQKMLSSIVSKVSMYPQSVGRVHANELISINLFDEKSSNLPHAQPKRTADGMHRGVLKSLFLLNYRRFPNQIFRIYWEHYWEYNSCFLKLINKYNIEKMWVELFFCHFYIPVV